MTAIRVTNTLITTISLVLIVGLSPVVEFDPAGLVVGEERVVPDGLWSGPTTVTFICN